MLSPWQRANAQKFSLSLFGGELTIINMFDLIIAYG